MRNLRLLKSLLIVFSVISIGIFTFACVQNDTDISGSYGNTDSVLSSDNSINPEGIGVDSETEESPSETEIILPTPNMSATKDEVNTEIAESFFNGEWESSSGMLYIFNGTKGTLVLKEKATGEVLLEGTYKAFSEDFSEFSLSMTFHGETDTFVAWKYSDSGSVRLIIEETGKTYDILWRVDS